MTTMRDVRRIAAKFGASVDAGRWRDGLDVTITAPAGKNFRATGSPWIVGHQTYGRATADVCADMIERMSEGLEDA